jgi:hypothetical protein
VNERAARHRRSRPPPEPVAAAAGGRAPWLTRRQLAGAERVKPPAAGAGRRGRPRPITHSPVGRSKRAGEAAASAGAGRRGGGWPRAGAQLIRPGRRRVSRELPPEPLAAAARSGNHWLGVHATAGAHSRDDWRMCA